MADGGGAETAGRSRALAPKGHRNLATGSRSNALRKLHPPSFQVRAGAAFLLFARSVASRKQDNLDRQAAFIFIIDFHLVPLIALAIVAAMTFWGVLPGRYF